MRVLLYARPALAGACFLLLLGSSQSVQASITLSVYDDPVTFRDALLDATHRNCIVVDFNDISTPPTGAICMQPTDASQYAWDHHITFHAVGGGGEWLSRNFGHPADYASVGLFGVDSGFPNVYAPGPQGGHGNMTDVTFVDMNFEDHPALVAAFGCHFIDADHPQDIESQFLLYDLSNQLIGSSGPVYGPTGSAKFCGVIAKDSVSNEAATSIARIRIISGMGWPDQNEWEGVVLDNFVYSDPIHLPEPATLSLLAVGAAAMVARRRVRR